jgi:hypothetical protein
MYESICMYILISACICVYVLVIVYMHVSVCMCMYLIFCFAQDAKGKTLPRPGPSALQCAVKKGIKGQQNRFDDSGTRTPAYMLRGLGFRV